MREIEQVNKKLPDKSGLGGGSRPDSYLENRRPFPRKLSASKKFGKRSSQPNLYWFESAIQYTSCFSSF
jgi:hypothetical protein